MSDSIEPVLGLIGGSGLYDIDGLEDREWRRVRTPWGEPSDELLFGRLEGVRCVFLPRHGRGHPAPPSALCHARRSRLSSPASAAASPRCARRRSANVAVR